MKKLTLLAVAGLMALASISHAQIVTPTPGTGLAGGLGRTASQSSTYRFKIDAGNIRSSGAATGGDLLLFTVPAGKSVLINNIVIEVKAKVTGGSISAATARVQGANNYGSAQDVFTAVVAPTVQAVQTTGTGYIEPAAQAVNLHLTSTGDNLNKVTTGDIIVWVTRTEL